MRLPISQLSPSTINTTAPPLAVITAVKANASDCTSSMYTPLVMTHCHGAYMPA